MTNSAKPVREIGTDRIFPSAAAVARDVPTHPNVVYRHLSEFRTPKTLKGRAFEYVTEPSK